MSASTFGAADVDAIRAWLLTTPHVGDGGETFLRGLVAELAVAACRSRARASAS